MLRYVFMEGRGNLPRSPPHPRKACSLLKGNVLVAVPITGERKISQDSEAKIKTCVRVCVYETKGRERECSEFVFFCTKNSIKFVRVEKESSWFKGT